MSNRVWKLRRSSRHHRERGRWVVDLDVDFSDEELREIETWSEQLGISVNDLVNQALRDWLDRRAA